MRKKDEKSNISQIASDVLKEHYIPKYGNQFDKAFTDEEIEKTGDEMLDYFKSHEEACYITAFSVHKLIHRQRLYEFEKKNEYFAKCMKIVRDIVLDRTLKAGYDGKKATFAIFMATNIAKDEFKHRQEITHAGSIEERVRNMTEEDRKKRIDELRKKLGKK